MSLGSHDTSPSREHSLTRSRSTLKHTVTTSRSTNKTVITVPRTPHVLIHNHLHSTLFLAWAKDEPDSLQDDVATVWDRGRQSGSPTTNAPPTSSELSATHSSSSNSNYLWSFVFPNLKRNRQFPSSSSIDLNEQNVDGSISSNTPARPILPKLINSTKRFSRFSPEGSAATDPSQFPRHGKLPLRLQLPLPPEPPFTVSHSKTPGWDSPWTPRISNSTSTRQGDLENNLADSIGDTSRTKESSDDNVNEKRKPLRKRVRSYLLHNNSVPLVCYCGLV